MERPAPVRVPEPEPPRSRFRKDPTAPVPRSPMVCDPTAAHVPAPSSDVAGRSIPVAEFYDPLHPDAVQFQRSTPPDPTRGLTVDDVEAEQERARGAARYYRPADYDGDWHY